MTSLFKSLDPKRHHILAVQEPWRNLQMPTTSRPPNYHLIYPLSKETRVCFYISKAINQNEWTTTEHSPDLVTLTIHRSSSPAATSPPYNCSHKRLVTRENTF
jgi:hypothetical protein